MYTYTSGLVAICVHLQIVFYIMSVDLIVCITNECHYLMSYPLPVGTFRMKAKLMNADQIDT